jgi:hypothetical protein
LRDQRPDDQQFYNGNAVSTPHLRSREYTDFSS